jgi:hypothetical protein
MDHIVDSSASGQIVRSRNMAEADNPLLLQRPTVNPYRFAAGEILRRLRWDVHPESWRSRRKIKFWKNKFLNQKAVIICNGPSLLKSDLSLLNGVFTFGLNKINLLFDRSNFRPSCIVSVNPFVIEQNAGFYNQTEIPLFLDSTGTRLVKSRNNVAFLHSSHQYKFARDCSMSLNQGYTVTFVAMQMAFHMGFKNIALIGCDHNFASKGYANQTVASGEHDKSHFDPRYFSGGVKWQLPDLVQSEIYYTMAREVFQAHGRSIVNATEGGDLHIFTRQRLNEFIKG